MLIMYIDIVLLVILMLLSIFTCCYCFYRVHRLRQAGQLTILLRPTKVVFSHRNEEDSTEELRSVVAYRNPFTGDYCVHKSRAAGLQRGLVNQLPETPPPHPAHSPTRSPASTDSGLSDLDQYEPLHLHRSAPHTQMEDTNQFTGCASPRPAPPQGSQYSCNLNCIDKTWNWNYKEYQI